MARKQAERAVAASTEAPVPVTNDPRPAWGIALGLTVAECEAQLKASPMLKHFPLGGTNHYEG